jgi:hypothetical protein
MAQREGCFQTVRRLHNGASVAYLIHHMQRSGTARQAPIRAGGDIAATDHKCHSPRRDLLLGRLAVKGPRFVSVAPSFRQVTCMACDDG